MFTLLQLINATSLHTALKPLYSHRVEPRPRQCQKISLWPWSKQSEALSCFWCSIRSEQAISSQEPGQRLASATHAAGRGREQSKLHITSKIFAGKRMKSLPMRDSPAPEIPLQGWIHTYIHSNWICFCSHSWSQLWEPTVSTRTNYPAVRLF